MEVLLLLLVFHEREDPIVRDVLDLIEARPVVGRVDFYRFDVDWLSFFAAQSLGPGLFADLLLDNF